MGGEEGVGGSREDSLQFPLTALPSVAIYRLGSATGLELHKANQVYQN